MLTTLREISVRVPSRQPDKSPDSVESPRDPDPTDQGTPTLSAPNESVTEVEAQSGTTTPSQSETSSTTPSQFTGREGSENGTETEEDEGMVLVGRPQ